MQEGGSKATTLVTHPETGLRDTEGNPPPGSGSAQARAGRWRQTLLVSMRPSMIHFMSRSRLSGVSSERYAYLLVKPRFG